MRTAAPWYSCSSCSPAGFRLWSSGPMSSGYKPDQEVKAHLLNSQSLSCRQNPKMPIFGKSPFPSWSMRIGVIHIADCASAFLGGSATKAAPKQSKTFDVIILLHGGQLEGYTQSFLFLGTPSSPVATQKFGSRSCLLYFMTRAP